MKKLALQQYHENRTKAKEEEEKQVAHFVKDDISKLREAFIKSPLSTVGINLAATEVFIGNRRRGAILLCQIGSAQEDLVILSYLESKATRGKSDLAVVLTCRYCGEPQAHVILSLTMTEIGRVLRLEETDQEHGENEVCEAKQIKTEIEQTPVATTAETLLGEFCDSFLALMRYADKKNLGE